MGHYAVRALGRDDFAAIMQLEDDVFGKGGESVLGAYGFNSNGDTTLKSYGLYKVGSDGEPVFFKTLTPTKTVG